MKELRYYLEPRYDGRKSFYHKAAVTETDTETCHTLTLWSYHTKVAASIVIKNVGRTVILYPKWDYSDTTLRHVKEFLSQNYGFVGTPKEMRKYYKSVGELLVSPHALDYIDKLLNEMGEVA